MKNLGTIIIAICLIALNSVVYGQEKDNPAVADEEVPTNTFEPTFENLIAFIDSCESIEAYRFSIANEETQPLKKLKTVRDENGFLKKFKVKRRIPQLIGMFADSVKTLLADDKNYDKENVPRCGNNPDMAFKFIRGENSVSFSISSLQILLNSGEKSSCSYGAFFYNDSLVVAGDFSQSRERFYEFGMYIFPDLYPPEINDISETEIQEQIENNATDDVDTNPNTSTVDDMETRTEAVSHTVKRYETIEKICEENQITIEKFKELNPEIKSNKDLKKGQQIRIK